MGSKDKNISIKYYCGERNEKSWIKIYEKDTIVIDIEYINPVEEPYIDFASGFEDWDIVNFGYHLAQHINQAKSNPNVPLFSNQNSEIS